MNRGPQISGTAIGFLTLAWISILLRSYCRVAIVKSFGSDDWLALFATILYTVYCSFSIEATKYGSGKPSAEIPLQDIPEGLKYWWICEPVYVMSALLIKLSIAVFLLRISIVKVHKIIIYVVQLVIIVISIAYFFIFIFQCKPSSYFWTRWAGASGSCLDTSVVINMSYGYSAFSCLTDWILGLLPIFIIWNLQMDSRTKLSVAVILAMGAVASTATIVRLPYLSGLSQVNNFLYATADVAIWSTIEVGMAISASSIATLRPLFRSFLEATTKLSSSAVHSRAGYFRSEGHSSIGLKLRNDGKKAGTVTTTIRAGNINSDSNDIQESEEPRNSRSEGKRGNTSVGDWNKSSRRLADDSGDDLDWSKGITKTMEIRTNMEIV